jgi:hypothetical protein
VPPPARVRHRNGAPAECRRGLLLDFRFPWSRSSAPGKNSKEDSGDENGAGESTTAQVVDDGKFGLMLFRQDCWRKPSAECPRSTHRVAAMYLVPETVTYGVPRRTFEHALACIRQQVSDPQSIPPLGDNSLVRTCSTEHAPGVETKKPTLNFGAKDLRNPNYSPAITFLNSSKLAGCGRMLLLGPSFSGSIDSVARVLAATLPDAKNSIAPDVCMLSVSTTAEANQFVVDYGAPQVLRPTDEKPTRPTFAAKYYSLAVRDDLKLEALVRLALDLGVDVTSNDVSGRTRGAPSRCCARNRPRRDCATAARDPIRSRKLKIIKMQFPPISPTSAITGRRSVRRRAPCDRRVRASGRLHLDEGAETAASIRTAAMPLTAASSELNSTTCRTWRAAAEAAGLQPTCIACSCSTCFGPVRGALMT